MTIRIAIRIAEPIKDCLNLNISTKNDVEDLLDYISTASDEENKDALKVFKEAKANVDDVSSKLGVVATLAEAYYDERMSLLNAVDEDDEPAYEKALDKVDDKFDALSKAIFKKFSKSSSVNESYHDVSGDPEDEDTVLSDFARMLKTAYTSLDDTTDVIIAALQSATELELGYTAEELQLCLDAADDIRTVLYNMSEKYGKK